ncbi:hypothetical protein [Mesorhizobium dulcispinae]|uniref:hypothetical protein n=1 Tax=Mesorhizobium dulcispinae TaxID=3072316 RepID=UPI002A23A1EA|nr:MULTISPECIES: hypothetical protein [unclassified Mesorhizobium]MDX8520248.1 hypothetical protein [Mesorhizobium sp. VK23D]
MLRLLAHRHQRHILGVIQHETRRHPQLRRHILKPFDQQLRQRTFFHSHYPMKTPSIRLRRERLKRNGWNKHASNIPSGLSFPIVLP